METEKLIFDDMVSVGQPACAKARELHRQMMRLAKVPTARIGSTSVQHKHDLVEFLVTEDLRYRLRRWLPADKKKGPREGLK